MVITKPLIMLFEANGTLVCHLWPRETDSFKGYGLMIADIVRHVANRFGVGEDQVWEWIDKERHNPTTAITRAS